MSKTTGMTGLQLGLGSVKKAGSDAFESRLDYFKKYAPIQSYSFNEETEAQKNRRESESFVDTAIGLKTTPSNTNLYEAHYQMAKDKADILFSDEVLDHYAKDKRSMADWVAKVDQLNQEITGYEAYYEDSFGDPSKADGKGNTWADHVVRSKHPGGEEGFWSDNGTEADRTSSLNDVMKIIDSRQHADMTFNFETGEFDYEKLVEQDGVPIGMDPFAVNPQASNELFSFNLTQTVFESPTDYAQKEMFTRVAGSPEQFNERMEKQKTSDSFLRAAADNYVKQRPDEGLSIDQVMQSEIMMQDAFEDFRDQTYDYIKENEKIAKRKAAQAKASKSTKLKPAFGSVVEVDSKSNPASVISRAPIEVLVMDGGVGKTIKSNTIGISSDGLTIVDKDGMHLPLDPQELANAVGREEAVRIIDELMPYQSQAKDTGGGGDILEEFDDTTWSDYTSNLQRIDSNLGGGMKQKAEVELLETLVQDEEGNFVEELHKAFPEMVAVSEDDADDFEGYKIPDSPRIKIEESGLGDYITITNLVTNEQKEFAIDADDKIKGRKIAKKIFEFINETE
tara:strand:- start:5967 stop:7664 length:1698 start_codon:yes stop_codon:yes gene_type:complete